jgi:hypothetical protein
VTAPRRSNWDPHFEQSIEAPREPRKATEAIDRDTSFLRHFEAEATALGQATFQLRDPGRHLLRSQVCFIGHRLILTFFSAARCHRNVDAKVARVYRVARAKSVAKPAIAWRRISSVAFPESAVTNIKSP